MRWRPAPASRPPPKGRLSEISVTTKRLDPKAKPPTSRTRAHVEPPARLEHSVELSQRSIAVQEHEDAVTKDASEAFVGIRQAAGIAEIERDVVERHRPRDLVRDGEARRGLVDSDGFIVDLSEHRSPVSEPTTDIEHAAEPGETETFHPSPVVVERDGRNEVAV